MGQYISQDRIKLSGNNPTLYAYVKDPNIWIDIFGLTGVYMFTDGATQYIGKGDSGRMYKSMRKRMGGRKNVNKALHIDYGNDDMGLMVEAELIDRHNALVDPKYHNKKQSPGAKKLASAKANNLTLYNQVIQNADAFEIEYNSKSQGIDCE